MSTKQLSSVKIMSFGFKYGSPNANYYFDVGFIKNPARDPKWNFFSTPDEEMRNFVLSQKPVVEFLKYIIPLIKILAPLDQAQVFAFGCNSGRHRSYILVEEIARQLKECGVPAKIVHREDDLQ
ncbi:RapZ C-terminal domain-containing protein [Geotalea daltonii]|uniref:RapZ C-terminal domain-containing protein n=1 Tax=Geotalea daltonii TaxID=1203471 RepID=UPI0006740DF3|nr:RNase adapter RapZ [Geotalea daltonii]